MRPPSAPTPTAARFRTAALTFAVLAGSSLCFCGKGILVKMTYRHGLDTVTTLSLRNLLALPFFLLGLVWSERRASSRLTWADAGRILILGFLGYYLSSFVNFLGLEHLSVGLERMILYTYPSLVVLGSALWFRRRLRWSTAAALLIAYGGLVLGFWAEHRTGVAGNLPLGAALVFASALTYALFTLGSSEMVRRLGPIRFMSWALVASALLVLLHFTLTHDWCSLVQIPAPAWTIGGLLAIFGTVVPSYLFAWGLHRAEASTAAIIGMVGPLGTVVLASLFLHEPVTALQFTGLLLTLVGGIAVAWQRAAARTGIAIEPKASRLRPKQD